MFSLKLVISNYSQSRTDSSVYSVHKHTLSIKTQEKNILKACRSFFFTAPRFHQLPEPFSIIQHGSWRFTRIRDLSRAYLNLHTFSFHVAGSMQLPFPYILFDTRDQPRFQWSHIMFSMEDWMQLMVPIVQVRGNILLSASVRREIIEGLVLWMAGRVNMSTNKSQQLFDVQSSTQDKQDPDAE